MLDEVYNLGLERRRRAARGSTVDQPDTSPADGRALSRAFLELAVELEEMSGGDDECGDDDGTKPSLHLRYRDGI